MSLVGVIVAVLSNIVTQTWNVWPVGALLVLTAVLMVAPNLGAEAEAGRGRSGRPAQLPAPLGTKLFVGRGRELAVLTKPVRNVDRTRPAVFVINGMPGVGKTELAIRAWTSLADRYPDGCLWLGLRAYAATESRIGPERRLIDMAGCLLPRAQRGGTSAAVG